MKFGRFFFEKKRERNIHDLSESEKVCSDCNHSMHEMSTQVRKELKIIPTQVTVVEHVQHIYSCRHCETHEIKTPIKKAEMSRPVIPKGHASPSAVAFVMIQKFADCRPLYRQEKQLERMRLPLSRQTISNWVLSSTTSWLKPLYAELYRRLRQEEVLLQALSHTVSSRLSRKMGSIQFSTYNIFSKNYHSVNWRNSSP